MNSMVQAEKAYIGGMDSVQEPVEVRLKNRRQALLNQVADLDKAIEILEKKPDFLEALNVLRKVGI